jgi:hypothetical protein
VYHAVVHEKGKPIVRWGRKATSLLEVVGLPKGVEVDPGITAEQPVPLHCLCGHSILCQVLREGERLGSLVFFDDELTNSTYGECIEHCPTCSQKLALHRLLPRRLHEGKPAENLR